MGTSGRILAGCLTITSIGTFAQAYRPFPENNAFWVDAWWWNQGTASDWGHDGVNAYFFGTDTMVGGSAYHKLMRNSLSRDYLIVPPNTSNTYYGTGQLCGLIRQDSAVRQVYFYDLDSLQEYLLYDFSIGLGTYPATYNNPGYPAAQVVAIDSVLLADGYHRRLRLNFIEHDVIEGLGSTFGLLASIESVADGMHAMDLLCHSRAGNVIYQWPYVPPGFQCGIWLSTPEPEHTLEFSLRPNPALDRFEITTDAGDATFRLIDLGGRIVKEGRCGPDGSTAIDVSGSAPGLYTVEVMGSSKLFRGKLIKQ